MTLFRVATVVLVVASVVVASFVAVRDEPEDDSDRQALIGYFRGPFDGLHKQTRMVQGGLAGLVEGGRAEVPSPERAAAILRDNILPSIDYLVAEARKIRVSEEVVAELHDSYVEVLVATRGDAARLIEIFEREDIEPAAARREATLVIAEIGQRFHDWSEHTRTVWESHGIVVVSADGSVDAR